METPRCRAYETKLTSRYYYKAISVNHLRKFKSYLKFESVMYTDETVSSFSLVGAINKSNERVGNKLLLCMIIHFEFSYCSTL